MKRKDTFLVIQPLTEKLYRFAYAIMPDDLQAEQLVVDGVNAFLLKEKKSILNREIDVTNKKDLQILRRTYFKSMLHYMSDIGSRRAMQLMEQMKLGRPDEFQSYYSLEAKVRIVLQLRFDLQFSVEEIEDILNIPRYEVIEKIHNGRFLMLDKLKQGVTV
jgi:hypothetical protein